MTLNERVNHLVLGLTGDNRNLYFGLPEEDSDKDHITTNNYKVAIDSLVRAMIPLADLLADGARYRDQKTVIFRQKLGEYEDFL